jgi:hypothetical protein
MPTVARLPSFTSRRASISIAVLAETELDGAGSLGWVKSLKGFAMIARLVGHVRRHGIGYMVIVFALGSSASAATMAEIGRVNTETTQVQVAVPGQGSSGGSEPTGIRLPRLGIIKAECRIESVLFQAFFKNTTAQTEDFASQNYTGLLQPGDAVFIGQYAPATFQVSSRPSSATGVVSGLVDASAGECRVTAEITQAR